MPSTSAKQHRFMEAVAHNPAFAKKAGVPQSVGKDYSAADKGKKFSGGGRAALQKLNKQDTQHGAMDMPFKSLKKFGGMKSGGSVKKYAKGGSLERLGEPQSFKDAFREARAEGASTFTWRGTKYKTKLDEGKKASPTPAAPAAPSNKDARDLRVDAANRNSEIANRNSEMGYYRGMADDENAALLARSPKPVEADLGSLPMKKGGFVKKSMGMHKMPDGMMMKNSAMRGMAPGMKKGGMPMKDGKPAFMKGMNMGGTAKYAKGGSVSARADGIATKGKTKGKMI